MYLLVIMLGLMLHSCPLWSCGHVPTHPHKLPYISCILFIHPKYVRLFFAYSAMPYHWLFTPSLPILTINLPCWVNAPLPTMPTINRLWPRPYPIGIYSNLATKLPTKKPLLCLLIDTDNLRLSVPINLLTMPTITGMWPRTYHAGLMPHCPLCPPSTYAPTLFALMVGFTGYARTRGNGDFFGLLLGIWGLNAALVTISATALTYYRRRGLPLPRLDNKRPFT